MVIELNYVSGVESGSSAKPLVMQSPVRMMATIAIRMNNEAVAFFQAGHCSPMSSLVVVGSVVSSTGMVLCRTFIVGLVKLAMS